MGSHERAAQENMRGIFFYALFVLMIPAGYGQNQAAPEIPSREIAVTFDDLPATHIGLEQMTAVVTNLLQTITSHNIPAIGFVNEGKLHVPGETDARTALLRRWLDAGLELGNHTFSHISIDRVPFTVYKDDLIQGETVTRMLLHEKGKRLRYFRHPQLRTGSTKEYKKSLDSLLAVRRYTVAPVTIDNNEFVFAAVYARAKRMNDSKFMHFIVQKYILYMEEIFEHFERLSTSSLGYEVKQILLLHANELNADHFKEVVSMIKRRGYTFISLEQALTDPAYRLPEAPSGRGLSWLHRWRLAKGGSMEPEPNVPEDITQLFRTYDP